MPSPSYPVARRNGGKAAEAQARACRRGPQGLCDSVCVASAYVYVPERNCGATCCPERLLSARESERV